MNTKTMNTNTVVAVVAVAVVAVVAVVVVAAMWFIRREKKEGYTSADRLACMNVCHFAGPIHSPAHTTCRDRCEASGGDPHIDPLTGLAGLTGPDAFGWTMSSCNRAGYVWENATKTCVNVPVRCKWDPPCGTDGSCSDPSRSCRGGCCTCKDPRMWNSYKKDCSGKFDQFDVTRGLLTGA